MVNVNWNSASKDYGTVDFDIDKDLVVTFYYKSVQDVVKSREQSMPIFNDVVYVKIFRPGEQLNVIDRPMVQQDQRRFRRQWEAFLDKRSQVPEGTPVDLLFPNNPSVADSLKARGMYTIQQLANLTAHAIETIGMGGQEYVNRAKKYLEAASSGESFIKQQENTKRLQDENTRLTRDVNSLRTQLDGLLNSLKASGAIEQGRTNPTPAIPLDAQAERIKSNHISTELAKKRGKNE